LIRQVLPFLWKPVAGALLLAAAWFAGERAGIHRAEAACQTAALEAAIAELERQKREGDAALEDLNRRLAEADAENQKLNEEAEAYVAQLESSDACILSDDDARRLRAIR
jgi:uncharacterized coiled-coil protein SlyX